MPELPEVENVRLGLARSVIGRSVVAVHIQRADVIQGPDKPADLLRGTTITQINRLGKQLALTGSASKAPGNRPQTPCVCVHLGMTGSLRYYMKGCQDESTAHTHVVWHLDDGGTLAFRDPRRFGGLWTYPSHETLESERWSHLGPDALTITPSKLHNALQCTRRPLKAALLDQNLVAGLGNIYVDELLFACRLHPMTPANLCTAQQAKQLIHAMRRLLKRAIQSGGSTLRDYVGADGQSGGFQFKHKVYGRSGQACVRCNDLLTQIQIAGRTTVCCNACQR